MGKRTRMFFSSADWMPRNFLRRVELCWPVKDPAIRKRVFDEILYASLADNRKAWSLGPDGAYARAVPGPREPVLRSQEWLLHEERRLAETGTPGRRGVRTLLRGAVDIEDEAERESAPAADPWRRAPAAGPAPRRKSSRRTTADG
jgi:hypothetical protein